MTCKISSSKKIASDLFFKMASEGVSYYFTSYGPDYEALSKLGFDVEKIKEAIKGAQYLEDVHAKLEEMSF